MDTIARFSLHDANALLPLVKSIGREIVERRSCRWRLRHQRLQLEGATTPEGLCQSLANLDAQIVTQDEALDLARGELEGLGLTVLRINPLTVHFPGASRSGDVVFCWQEDEDGVCFGHQVGEEEDPRRPLKLRAQEH